MSDPRPRYWIATHEPGFFTPKHVLSLPDAEHIHVTRHPDGTITATPMEYHGHKHQPSRTTWIYGPERPATAEEIVLWADIEEPA